MSNIKYLLKNIGLLTISQFSSKILSFLLVPLYTSVLSTEEYGSYGLYSTTISLLVPILTVNLSESALRFSLEKNYNKKNVFSFCFKYVLIGTIVISGVSLINHFTSIIPVLDQYWYYLIIMFFTTALNCLLMAFARGIDKIFNLAISGLIGTIGVLFFNIYFLVVLRWGLNGYFLANILGTSVQMVYLSISIKIWTYITFGKTKNPYREELIKYSWPLVGNSVSWWVNDASDRYIVTWLCGVADNGIYSVGYKIPSILSVFQTIFNQAWTLSAVKEYDSKNSSEFFSKTYLVYSFIMTMMCSLLIIFDKFLAKLLYANNFYEAWRYVPFLLIATVFGAMSGHIGGVFSAVKATKAYASSTVIGAISNLILNIILISCVGTLGAAIATLISNIIVWILRLSHAKKYIQMNIKMGKCCASYVLLLLQTMILFIVNNSYLAYAIEFILFIIIIILFIPEIKICLRTIKKFLIKESNIN